MSERTAPATRHPREDNRQRIWERVRQAPVTGLSVPDVAMDTGISAATVRSFLLDLAGWGLIEARGEHRPQRYHLTEAGRRFGTDAPRSRRGKLVGTPDAEIAQMWATLKILKVFTSAGLAEEASTADVPVTEAHARDYCRALHAAGYLRRERRQAYAFVRARDTGPLPPRLMRVMYDANLGAYQGDPTGGTATTSNRRARR